MIDFILHLSSGRSISGVGGRRASSAQVFGSGERRLFRRDAKIAMGHIKGETAVQECVEEKQEQAPHLLVIGSP
jgi:hypothetical protein